MKRVVVGLSGGVDSSVSAYLLQKQGYEVIGLFMKNWHDDSVTISDECPWLEDSNDALMVAEKLGIPFQTVDMSVPYKQRIVDYMFREYERGRTPNPDVLCNREIKFDTFMEYALNLGADYVATGHYCRKEEIEVNGHTIYRLLAGKDQNKDQSYFLCQLSQAQLSRALFPIGDLPEFLQQQLAPKRGDIIQIPSTWQGYQDKESRKLFECYEDELKYYTEKYHYSPTDGKVVGQHEGAHFFTIGQRKGLHVGGTVEPLFVIDTDTEKNIIYVGEGHAHPGLFRRTLFVKKEDIHWIRTDLALSLHQTMEVAVRIRYRQPLQKATLYLTDSGLYVDFSTAQSAITSGQFAAWYLDDELIGSGEIY